MSKGIRILLDSNRGIYIPQHFAEDFAIHSVDGEGWEGISEKDRETLLAGPDAEWYWDTWADVVDHATYTDTDGNVWRLYQDGDLFAICDELMTDDDYKNFFGEERE